MGQDNMDVGVSHVMKLIDGILWITLTRRDRHNTGGTTVTHYIQCGGGRSGSPLGVFGSGTVGGGGYQQQQQQRDTAVGKDNPVKRQRPTVER